MPDLLQQGAVWLSDRLKQSAGRPVTMLRGGFELRQLIGTPTEQVYEVIERDGSVTQVQSMDWTIRTADLPAIPRPGDRLRELLGDVNVEYEVTPIGSKPCFEWLDTSCVVLVIHSKKVPLAV